MKIFISFLIILNFTILYSQSNLEPGYFITNDNIKYDVLIPIVNYNINPVGVRVKDGEEFKKYSLNDIKEFGLYDGSLKFVKADVLVDLSSEKSNNLSPTKESKTKTETVFLRQLVEGDVSLFSYSTNLNTRFYYQVNHETITLLTYKRFQNNTTRSNTKKYLKQLYDISKCDEIKFDQLAKVEYQKESLTQYIIQENNCRNVSAVKYSRKNKHKPISLIGNIGLASHTTTGKLRRFDTFLGNSSGSNNYDYGNEIGLFVNATLEYRLDLISNKWSLLTSLSYYQPYNFEAIRAIDQGVEYPQEIQIKYLGVSLGPRKYFYLTNSLRLNVDLLLELKMISEQELIGGDLKNDIGFTLGSGIELFKKYNINIVYQPKNLWSAGGEIFKPNGYPVFTTNHSYSRLSVSVGYRFL